MKPSAKLPIALAYDLGGTKVAVGVVDERGKVLDEIRLPVVLDEGKAAVIRQLANIGSEFIRRHPRIKRVGMASAGPLDPEKGILLDPTNFKTQDGKSWGRVPIAKLLSEKLKRPVIVENDAAAAMLAEHWVGAARGYKNAMILTLGTGLGTGIVTNGTLVRAGQGQHPEAGHLILCPTEKSAPCGCGNFGCAEAFLSGVNFTRRAQAALGRPDLSTVEIADLARKGDKRARALFEDYSMWMATAIHNYAVIYCPEIVVFTGSFAYASDLFLDRTRELLEARLERRRAGTDLMPKLALSKLHNNAGIIGAAQVALHR